MKSINATQLKAMMIYMCSEMINSKEIMCEADRHIGDGDHGIGMAKGFEAARANLEDQTFDDVYKIFFTIGRTMIKEMGGASGIIFGMLFYAGSKDIAPSQTLNVKDFSIVFEKALSEIKTRGKAQPGDKTVVDALQPMVEVMQRNIENDLSFKEMVKIALIAANQGKENSKKYLAKYGRAKTLGERAIGYPDAGAVSLSLIMQYIFDWLNMQ
jgi:dihydroxyacetone kinase phosphoprotein-dependent L subunit